MTNAEIETLIDNLDLTVKIDMSLSDYVDKCWYLDSLQPFSKWSLKDKYVLYRQSRPGYESFIDSWIISSIDPANISKMRIISMSLYYKMFQGSIMRLMGRFL